MPRRGLLRGRVMYAFVLCCFMVSAPTSDRGACDGRGCRVLRGSVLEAGPQPCWPSDSCQGGSCSGSDASGGSSSARRGLWNRMMERRASKFWSRGDGPLRLRKRSQ